LIIFFIALPSRESENVECASDREYGRITALSRHLIRVRQNPRNDNCLNGNDLAAAL